MRIRTFLLPVLMVVSLNGISATAQHTMVNSDVDLTTGARIEIRSVFEPPPPSGYVPLKITISAGDNPDSVWRLAFECKSQDYPKANTVTSQVAIPMASGTKRTTSFLMPLTARYGNAGYNNGLQMAITLAGAFNRTFNDYYQPVSQMPAIAISSDLANGNARDLEEALKKKISSSGRFGPESKFASEFNPSDAPEDWLGYSGFDYVMLQEKDWRAFSPAARHALLQWVRLGGKLHFYLKDRGTAPADLPAVQTHRSLGLVHHLTLPASGKLAADETVERYWDGRQHTKQLYETHASDVKWQLLQDIGQRSSGSWQVVLFLLAFGILVGPVNLFVLAPSGRRHRLFYTTPLISLGASVLMFGVILIQDGIGGNGSRFALVDLQPDEATAYITQKQVSRTGMLLGTGFDLKQPALIEPLTLPASPWAKLTGDYKSQPVNLIEDGAARSGTFFQSRTEQAHLIRAAVPSRARLEVTPGVVPQVVSALGFTVDELFYADAEGKVWKQTGALATGQKADLKEVPFSELQEWWREKAEVGALAGDGRFWDSLPKNQFIASAAEAPGFMQETLPSVRWQQQHILVHGNTAP